MTPVSFTRRFALLATLASSLWLVACNIGGGGGGGGGQTNIRALNLTGDLPSIDLYIGGNKQFSALATGALANYVTLDANSYTINVSSAGNTLFTSAYSLSKDQHYTALVWGPQSSLRVSTLPEDEVSTSFNDVNNNTRVRMFNATTETGAVDVYLTAVGADLSTTSPTQTVSGGFLSGFHEIPAGTYELRVTGVGNPTDVRLDIKPLALGASQFSTLVLTGTSGGVLVNGTLIVQQGAAQAMANTKARVRVVASVDSSGVVDATAGGKSLGSGLHSPVTGQYTLVDAGPAVATSVSVNGNPISTGALAFSAGADYTLLAYGPANAAQVAPPITDDNRLLLSTSRTKIRLVNAVWGLDGLTLSVDNGIVGFPVPVEAGTASPYLSIASNSTGAFLEADSPSLGMVYQTTRTNGDVLAAQGVYTVFILSGKDKVTGLPAPVGRLVNERP